jgi:cellulose synthase/poly-beta-1,6-N-acetylglucosamine synthase-like glycosyltransferase
VSKHLKKPKTYVRESAKQGATGDQKNFLILVAIIAVGWAILDLHLFLVVLVSAAVVMIVISVSMKALVHAVGHYYVEPETLISDLDDPDLPFYTVLIPMYKEANVVSAHIRSMRALSYPQDKLEVIHLLEADDDSTREALDREDLSGIFRRCEIPNVGPQTKPKALNYGLAVARGECVCVFDAEDKPEPDQLLKAAALFRASPEHVIAQAELRFVEGKKWYNWFYRTDYGVHFTEMLRGLTKLGLTFPLGGTSNHFRVSELRELAISPKKLDRGMEGLVNSWDPYNVTEDADLGAGAARAGWKVIRLDSFTEEESPNHLWGKGGAAFQRRRWLKGYLETALVHTRHPITSARQMGVRDYLSYMLMMIGTPLTLLLNVPFWGLTIAYIATRSVSIQQLFPVTVYYIGLSVMVFGFMGLFYQSLITCCRSSDWKAVPMMFLLPVWWAFNSIVACMTFYEWLNPATRYHWNKTDHGHATEEVVNTTKEAVLV